MNELKNIKIAISCLPKKGWWNNGIVAYHDNNMMFHGAIPNQSLLLKEHNELIKILSKYSLKTISVSFKNELEVKKKYDFVFMRDHFLCNANNEIIMCNMKLPERMNEGEYVISTLNDLKYKVSFLDDECIAEGGEFFFLPKENILLSGKSRNNLKGAEQMADKMKTSNLHIIPSSGYHLDTSISPLFNEKYECVGIICAKEVFNNDEIINLRNICKINQWELIEIEHQNIQESINFRSSINGLTLPGLFIGSKKLNNKKILEFSSANKIILESTPASQFNLSGGSIHCLTNELF